LEAACQQFLVQWGGPFEWDVGDVDLALLFEGLAQNVHGVNIGRGFGHQVVPMAPPAHPGCQW
jgi:hypothetical protein